MHAGHAGHAVPPEVRMVNDIAANLGHRPVDQAVQAVAHHVRRYWDPRMRAALLAHVDGGGAGLDPISLAAAALLRR